MLNVITTIKKKKRREMLKKKLGSQATYIRTKSCPREAE